MKIAACLIVKNEARDVAEWIAYHSVLGIDAFLVYENASTDGTATVLNAAGQLLDVRVTPWHSSSGQAQVEAYRHAMQTNPSEFDWIAVIDSDEFLVVHPPHTLHSLCESAAHADAIGINWAMFGSNGHVDLPRSLLIEAFTRRSDSAFGPNQHVKCIVRPGTVMNCCNPHAFEVGGHTTRPDGGALAWQSTGGEVQPGLAAGTPDYAIAQVNHYFTRSRAHWMRKTARGYPNPVSRGKLNHFDLYDRNEIEDRSALRSLPLVAQRRAQILDKTLTRARRPFDVTDRRQPVAHVDHRLGMTTTA